MESRSLINTTTNKPMNMNIEEEKMQLQEIVNEYFNSIETQKRLRQHFFNALGAKSANRFTINIDELRQINEQLVKHYLVKQPLMTIKAFEEALNKTLKSMREELSSSGKGGNEKTAARTDTFPSKSQVFYINFEGNLGKNHVTPRGLRSEMLNNFVAVQGIVTKMSIVRPQLQTSVHYCEKTRRGYVKNYEDQYNIEKLAEELEGREQEDGNALMTRDESGNPL